MKISNIVFYMIIIAIAVVAGKIGYSEYKALEQMDREIAESKIKNQQLLAEVEAVKVKNQAQIDRLDRLHDKVEKLRWPTEQIDTDIQALYPDYEYILAGGGHSGYFVTKKKGESCAKVTGLTDKDLLFLGMNLREFKRNIKRQTGERCVLFE